MMGQRLYFAQVARIKASRESAGLKNCDVNFITRNVDLAGEPDLLAEKQ